MLPPLGITWYGDPATALPPGCAPGIPQSPPAIPG